METINALARRLGRDLALIANAYIAPPPDAKVVVQQNVRKEEGLPVMCFYGHYEYAEILLAQQPLDAPRALILACEGDHLEIARMLLRNRHTSTAPDCWGWAINAACKNGNLDIVKELARWRYARCSWGWAFPAACQGGHMEIFDFLLTQGTPNLKHCMDAALEGGHSDMIKRVVHLGEKTT